MTKTARKTDQKPVAQKNENKLAAGATYSTFSDLQVMIGGTIDMNGDNPHRNLMNIAVQQKLSNLFQNGDTQGSFKRF